MPKVSFSAHPYLLGFDQLEKLLERSANSGQDGFPPYNIEQPSDNTFRISFAVAGFRLDELSVIVEGPQLVVSGQQTTQLGDREFIHQGIAARQFKRVFVLAGCIETKGATLENGLLYLDLERIEKAEITQRIEINSSSGS